MPNLLTITDERFQCPEALFDPRAYTGKDLIVAGIHSMVAKSVLEVGLDLARPMYKNVVIAGGTSMMTGFARRLKEELVQLAPPSMEINVVAAEQRHLAAWIGGTAHWLGLGCGPLAFCRFPGKRRALQPGTALKRLESIRAVPTTKWAPILPDCHSLVTPRNSHRVTWPLTAVRVEVIRRLYNVNCTHRPGAYP